jgi:hypothetical protein
VLPVGVLTEADITEARDKELEIRRQISAIDDQLLALNTGITIEIPDADVELLRRHRII